MDIVLKVKNKPKKGDVLVFNGSQFECVSKESFLRDLSNNIKGLQLSVGNISETLQNILADIKLLKGEE